MPSPLEVTFSSGDVVNDTACATFGIVNDDNLEFDHGFIVTLAMITPNGPVISIPSSTTVSISDDEGIQCVAFTYVSSIMIQCYKSRHTSQD